jgi:hypothetical protein
VTFGIAPPARICDKRIRRGAKKKEEVVNTGQ